MSKEETEIIMLKILGAIIYRGSLDFKLLCFNLFSIYINLPLSFGFVVLSGALENLLCCVTKF